MKFRYKGPNIENRNQYTEYEEKGAPILVLSDKNLIRGIFKRELEWSRRTKSKAEHKK